MPDDPVLDLPERPTETPADTPTRRRRPFTLDREATARDVLDRVRRAQEERQTWMDQRVVRYAKLRGWLESKDWPWTNASNQHLPIMIADTLRIEAGLFNAVIGIRPAMQAKTLRRELKDQGERISALIDYQVFTEAKGDETIGAFIDSGVEDGTGLAYVPWVRDQRTVRDVRVLQTPTEPLAVAFPKLATDVIFSRRAVEQAERLDEAGYAWKVTLASPDPIQPPTVVDVEIYDRDDRSIEVMLTWEATVYDGPGIHVYALEDVVVPMRSENCQPVTPENPFGAPWVALLDRVDLDGLKRLKVDGTYDLLTEEDLEALTGRLAPRVPESQDTVDEDRVKRFHDRQAGLEPNPTDEERDWLTVVKWFGRADLNDDGLDEDVIFWIIRETETLVRARYLTEMFPMLPPRRPFGEWRPLPVKGQFYGVSFPELMEGLHDLIHVLFNQTIDYGTITNLPWFAYRASSGFKPEVYHISPGEGIPLDNPQTDLNLPSWPGRDQSWGLNMVAFGIQMLDRLVQIGPLQLGQVPTGKASALRTVGTTMAILQQGAALPERVLRRLFLGLQQIWGLIHALNGKHLPRKKEFLIAGKPLGHEDAYGMIEQASDLEVPVIFDFEATLLNTNKGLVSQALMGLGTALVNPLMMQTGIVDKEGLYRWAYDLIHANQLDPGRYLKRPPDVPEGPRILAEEAISLLLEGQLPQAAPLEPIQEHFQKLQAFMQSEQFGLLGSSGAVLFRTYLQSVAALLRQEMQQQQLQRAAQQFSQALQSESSGIGGVTSGIATSPMQTEAPLMSEVAGATQRRGEGR